MYQKYQDPSMQRLFEVLPAFVQENIIQSGAQPATAEELASLAGNLMRSSDPQAFSGGIH